MAKGGTPDTLTAEQLCALTGLSDQRHRQLATAGYFPKPVDARWDFTKTIKGLLTYYRESRGKAKMDIEGAKLRKLTLDAQIAELKLEQTRGSLISLDEMQRYMRGTVTRWDLLNKMKFEVEGPMLLQGKPIAETRAILKRLNDESRKIWNEGLTEWKPTT
jgi:hypothetical protein